MHNVRHVDIKAEPVTLGAGLLASYKIAHLTGTTPLTLSPEQEGELFDFIDKGGTLIVDAAGGSTDFADSAEMILEDSSATAAGLDRPLPYDHVLFTTPGEGRSCRATGELARNSLWGHLRDPLIRAVTVGKGRSACSSAAEDLTEGLVGEPVMASSVTARKPRRN